MYKPFMSRSTFKVQNYYPSVPLIKNLNNDFCQNTLIIKL